MAKSMVGKIRTFLALAVVIGWILFQGVSPAWAWDAGCCSPSGCCQCSEIGGILLEPGPSTCSAGPMQDEGNGYLKVAKTSSGGGVDYFTVTVKDGGLSCTIQLCYERPSNDSSGDYHRKDDQTISGRPVSAEFRTMYHGSYILKGANGWRIENVPVVNDPTSSTTKFFLNDTFIKDVTVQGGRARSGHSQGLSWEQDYNGNEKISLLTEYRNGLVVRKVYYQYHQVQVNNQAGTRQRVTEETYNSDGTKRFLTTLYDCDLNGHVYMIVKPDGVSRYLQDGHLDQGIDSDHPENECVLDSVSGSSLVSFASAQYEYDADGRVTYSHSSSCCASANLGHRYQYSDGTSANSDYSTATSCDQWNTWRTWKRTLPVGSDGNARTDATWKVEFLNTKGGLVCEVDQQVDSSGEVAAKWLTHRVYYSDRSLSSSDVRIGRVQEERHPSACKQYNCSTASDGATYYNLSTAKWVNGYTATSGTDGVVDSYDYHIPSGQLLWQKVRRGITTVDDKYYVREYTYGTDDSQGTANGVTYNGYTTFPLRRERIYLAQTGASGSSGSEETLHEYTFYANTHAVETETVTYQTVGTDNNGSGIPAVVRYHYYQGVTGTNGNNVYYKDWTQHEDGTYSYVSEGTDDYNFGQVVTSIEDVNTNTLAAPTGWVSRTGLHLTKLYTYYGGTTDDQYPSGSPTRIFAGPLKELQNLGSGGRISRYEYLSRSQSSGTATTTTALVNLTAPHMDTGDYSLGPISIQVSDLAGRTLLSASGAAATSTDGNMGSDFSSNWYTAGNNSVGTLKAKYNGTLYNVSQNLYDNDGRLVENRRYHDIHDIEESSDGTVATNYYRTIQQYDQLGHQQYLIQVVSGTDAASGVEQVIMKDYDHRGRVVSIYAIVSGTDQNMGADYSNHPTADRISTVYYDEATPGNGTSGVGDGVVTSVDACWGTDTGESVRTAYHYNWRHQLRGVQPPAAPFTVQDVDWAGRTTAAAQYSQMSSWSGAEGTDAYAGTTTAHRLSLSKSLYDKRGRAYRSEVYSVNSSGSTDGVLTSDSYYDQEGRLAASKSPGRGVTEFAYDGVGRQTESRVVLALKGGGANGNYDSVGGFVYCNPQPQGTSGGDDGMIEMARTSYDAAGNATERIQYEANHTAASGLDLSDSGTFVRTFTYSHYDLLGRTTATAYCGTNGTANDWKYFADLAYASDLSISTTGDYISTQYSYGSDGRPFEVTDNRGLKTRQFYDGLGRTVYVAENWADFAVESDGSIGSAGDATDHSKDRVTQRQYNGFSQVTKLTALDSNGDGDTTANDNQTTTYLFEDGHNAGLTTSIIYPESTDTTSTGDDQVKFTYALDGKPTSRTSQKHSGEANATVLAYDYDTLRRPLGQRATTLGTNVDGTVRAILTGYDILGRVEKVTSYASADSSGTVVNEVERSYDGLGRVVKDYQAHAGTVGTDTTPRVEYGYVAATGGVFDKGLRLVSQSFPVTGTATPTLTQYAYGTSGANDALSRLETIQDNSGAALSQYAYNGLGRLVRETYKNSGATTVAELDYVQGTDGNYRGFDRFARVVNQRWNNSAGTAVDRYQYGYDRNSNRLYRDDQVTAGTADVRDWSYEYDGLNRLKTAKQGTWTSGAISTPTAAEQNFGLDQLGNWKTFDLLTSGSAVLNQTRTNNLVNELTTIGVAPGGQGAAWATPVYDARGNMITIPKPGDETHTFTATYDAWNRQMKIVDTSTSATVAEYRYDGLNRRIRKLVKEPGENNNWTVREFYYNASWQQLESRQATAVSRSGSPLSEPSAATSLYERYVWSPRYIDAPVLRQRSNGGTLNETLYYAGDANMNVTALIGTDGAAVERYAYDPYGKVTVLNPNWTADEDGVSDFDNAVLYCGYYRDKETGLYHVRYRYYHPTLGRWVTWDLIGYADGLNLYGAYFVPNRVDPTGLVCDDECKEGEKQPCRIEGPILTSTVALNAHTDEDMIEGGKAIDSFKAVGELTEAGKNVGTAAVNGGMKAIETAVKEGINYTAGKIGEGIVENAKEKTGVIDPGSGEDIISTFLESTKVLGLKMWYIVKRKTCKCDSCLLIFRMRSWSDDTIEEIPCDNVGKEDSRGSFRKPDTFKDLAAAKASMVACKKKAEDAMVKAGGCR